MTNTFTIKMEQHLKTVGWSKFKKNDQFQNYMDKHNYPDFLKSFMYQFSGLKIKQLSTKNPPSNSDERIFFDINLTEGIEGISEAYSGVFGRTLYPIAVLKPESCDISVDGNGYVYMLGEYCLCCGKDLYKGIEQLIRIDQRNMLELDPRNDDTETWLQYKDEQNTVVDFDTYEF